MISLSLTDHEAVMAAAALRKQARTVRASAAAANPRAEILDVIAARIEAARLRQ